MGGHLATLKKWNPKKNLKKWRKPSPDWQAYFHRSASLVTSLMTPSNSGPTSDSLSFSNTIKLNFHMKYKGNWTPDLSHRVQDRSKKNSFHGSGPWVISYRSSHKSPQSGNPMKCSSYDGRTDKVRTIAYFRKYAKNTRRLHYSKISILYCQLTRDATNWLAH